MIRFILVLYILLLICSYGCDFIDSSNIEKLSINVEDANKQVNLSELVDSISYIRLETNPNCLLGRIRQVIIKKNHIYILDISSHAIFVFDKYGKFVSKLDKRGKGPEEYSSLGPTLVDDDEKYIELFTNTNIGYSRVRYSIPDFKQIEKVKIPGSRMNSVSYLDDNYYFSSWGLPSSPEVEVKKHCVVVLKDSTIVGTLINKNVKASNHFYTPFLQPFTQNDNKELFISVPYDKYFYKLAAHDAIPFLELDFGRNGIREAIGKKTTDEQFEYIEKARNKAFFHLLSLNNDQIMVINYYHKREEEASNFSKEDKRTYINLKHNNKILHTKKIINDITAFPHEIDINIAPLNNAVRDVWHDGYLVDIVMPYDVMKDGVKEIFTNEVGSVSISDNPIIVLMKLN